MLAKHDEFWRQQRFYFWFCNTYTWVLCVAVSVFAWHAELLVTMWVYGLSAPVCFVWGNYKIIKVYRMVNRQRQGLIDSFDETHNHLIRSIDALAQVIKTLGPK